MTVRKRRKPHDSSLCGAEKKQANGETCTRPAGWGTDHVGQGRCKLHGGKSPVQHGRYSTISRPRLAELIARFEADPDPMNLLPEVVLLRALILDYIERYDAFTAALIAWHESYVDKNKTPNPKPTQVVDILAAGNFIGQIARVTERIQKQQQEGTVSLEAFNRYVEQLGVELVAAAQEAIADADSRSAFFAAIDRRWETVALDARPGRSRPAQGTSEG